MMEEEEWEKLTNSTQPIINHLKKAVNQGLSIPSRYFDLFDESKNKQLITSLSGKLKPLKSVKAAESLSKYSLSTIAALLLIHWQALKLFVKGAAFVSKPKQLAIRITNNLPSKKKDIVA